MDKKYIRNVAIIAHVDHGKTTLVDQMFKQSGLFRDNQKIEERIMDYNELEKERGITIASKNGSFFYKEYLINIIDTPGHADFGGQVERVLQMADGALLLVDAVEGPMPQTYFVLKKALALNLPIILIINKIDKPNTRVNWVLNEVFDLFVKLNSPDHILDFPVLYASAKNGYASKDENVLSGDMTPLFEEIINYIPSPDVQKNLPFQMLVSSIEHSQFLGRLAIGKITRGKVSINEEVSICSFDFNTYYSRITKIYTFDGISKQEKQEAFAGEIVAIAGIDDIKVGSTISAKDYPEPLKSLVVDPPSISMNFLVNDSPFAGKEGRFLTSRHLKERLHRESLSDIALQIEELDDSSGFKVSGRGELHLSILIEKMRREGYEFQVTRPKVIYKIIDNKKYEPYEDLTIDVDEKYMGSVIEKLGARKGVLINIIQENGMARIHYKIPTRGLIGFRTEFMSDTRGMGVMNYIFSGYDEWAGDISNRRKGSLVVKESCKTVAYALFNLQERGTLFLAPGEDVYEGQIIGENSREGDLVVNPGKGKKLTNIRASGSDENIILTPPVKMSLEKCISYINDDEMIEITPRSLRLRKVYLNENDRKKAKKELVNI